MTESRVTPRTFLAAPPAIDPLPPVGDPARGITSSATPTPAHAWLGRLGPALGLLLVVIVFALLAPEPARYLSSFNLRIVLSQTVIVALGAIGMTVIVVSGGIDLSVGAVIALTGVITAIALNRGVPPLVAVLAGVIAGAAVGFINGALVTTLRVVPFIVTLGMLGVARGVAKWAAHEQTVNAPPTWVNELLVTFPHPAWIMVPVGVWLTLALAILAAVVLARTVFGRHIFALGSNEAAAWACGIDTSRLKIATYSSAGLLFGLAGVMQMSRLRQGDPTVANGAELDIIAAVVIGGASLSGGEGSILGSMFGALIMAFLRNGCQQMGWPNYIQEIIIGAIIVAAVAIDRLRAQWAETRTSLVIADA
jgi:ribose transport system permease protein